MDSRADLELPKLITAYFDTLNNQDFQQTADLFIASAALIAPLGKCIRGRSAILAYLVAQCDGMQLYPETIIKSDGNLIIVEGQVHCLAFKVRTQWSFYLLHEALAVVKVQLLTKLTQLQYLQGSQYAQYLSL